MRGGGEQAQASVAGHHHHADGYILTKASELKGKIICKLKGRGEHLAKIVGMHEEYDLALLKIEADDLPVVSWAY